MPMSTTHNSSDQYRPTALVTKLLVIEQLLHPALKPAVSALNLSLLAANAGDGTVFVA